MLTIATLLKTKGNAIYWVEKGTSVIAALEVMADKGIGALLVMDDGQPVGIFSERDFARKVAKDKVVNLQQPVEDYMTWNIYCVSRDTTVDECMALMTNQRFRHLPVCDDNKLVGVISIGDVVKNLIEDKDLLIRNMENYMFGRGFGE